ncbi:MAG: hypothetical protein WKG07_48805 [Hymenobacter sp.]
MLTPARLPAGSHRAGAPPAPPRNPHPQGGGGAAAGRLSLRVQGHRAWSSTTCASTSTATRCAPSTGP